MIDVLTWKWQDWESHRAAHYWIHIIHKRKNGEKGRLTPQTLYYHLSTFLLPLTKRVESGGYFVSATSSEPSWLAPFSYYIWYHWLYSASISWSAKKVNRNANFYAHSVAHWAATRSFSGRISTVPPPLSYVPIVSGKDPPPTSLLGL